MPRPRRPRIAVNRRASYRSSRAHDRRLRALHSRAHRQHASVYQQSRFRSGRLRHLRLPEISASRTRSERHSAAEPMSVATTNPHHPRRSQVALLISVCLLLGIALASARAPQAQEGNITVVTSGAFTTAYLELVPEYERATHTKVVTEFGPSMGTTHNAIPIRLERGEAIDVVIMAAPGLDDLTKHGKIRPGSRVDLVQSKMGMAVKAGAPKPDIRTLDALKRTLLAAKSIAYSDSASGVYLSTELFPKLGIADRIKSKCRKIEADPVGGVVASGEVEIGFQQISELRP